MIHWWFRLISIVLSQLKRLGKACTTHTLIAKGNAWSSRCAGLVFVLSFMIHGLGEVANGLIAAPVAPTVYYADVRSYPCRSLKCKPHLNMHIENVVCKYHYRYHYHLRVVDGQFFFRILPYFQSFQWFPFVSFCLFWWFRFAILGFSTCLFRGCSYQRFDCRH